MARTNTYKKNSSKPRETKGPVLIAWHVTEKSDSKGFWTRIGAAWDHDDGKGLTLQLDLVPVASGRIVLRVPGEATAEKGA